MEKFFAGCLIVTCLLYSFRSVGWLYTVIHVFLKTKTGYVLLKTLSEKNIMSFDKYFWSGLIEHGFIMFSLIGSIIVLL